MIEKENIRDENKQIYFIENKGGFVSKMPVTLKLILSTFKY